jgi:pimeloyl-ACP methyl ester carboxylesterase
LAPASTTFAAFVLSCTWCVPGSAASAVGAVASDRAVGHWVGVAELAGVALYTKLIVEPGEVTLHLPQRDVRYQALAPSGVAGADVAGRSSGGVSLSVEGRTVADEVRGTVTVGDSRGAARWVRYSPLPEGVAAPAEGTYRTLAGEWQLVRRFGDGLEVVDLASGRALAMWQSAHDTGSFVQVVPVVSAGPRAGAVTLRGDALRVDWGDGSAGAAVTVARRQPAYRAEEVTLQRADLRIAGSLALPPGPGPHRLALVLPGSGPHDRTARSVEQLALATAGYAVFAFDTRGVGGSTGEPGASYEDLTADALAMIETLAGRPDVDASRVLLLGHSQGAWIAPRVAAASPRVAELVLLSGSMAPPGEQTTWWVEHYLRTRGFPEAEVAEAVGYMRRVTAVMDARGDGWEALEPLVAAARRQPWWDFVVQPSSREDLLAWAGYYHQPAVALSAVRLPILAVFGDRDINVPAEASAAAMRRLLAELGLTGSRVEVFAGADHELRLAKSGNPELDWPYSSGYPPGYLRLLGEWVGGNRSANQAAPRGGQLLSPSPRRRPR